MTRSARAVLRNAKVPNQIAYSKEAEKAAKILGITVQLAEMQAPSDKALQDALAAVAKERANALLVTPDTFFADRRQRTIDFAVRNKLPAIYFGAGFVDDGGLMSYGPGPSILCGVAPLGTSTRFSKEQSPPIFRSSSRKNWS